MLFNSYVFVFAFLPLTLVLYYWTRKKFGREESFIVLVIASLVYYGYWRWSYLPILLTSIVVNYGFGLLLLRERELRRKKRTLVLGVVLNLAFLGYYKYADFFLHNVTAMVGGEHYTLNIVLPLAISFFTFQQIAYLVDAYRREAKEYSFSHYCLFIAFFPQLIAGPIVHHKEMLPQFMAKARELIDVNMFWQGLQLFCLGLFKKVLIADNLALFATPVFYAADHGQAVGAADAWIAKLAYTFQLYFDFSAYSDMAIGIGKMFGIELPKNFNSPYKARSITEFWRHWHMTLSRFLRDYVYFAFGGNRRGAIRRYINLLLTMVLGGLWHGASWNFVVWGGLHGLFLAVNHGWQSLTRGLGFNTNRASYRILAQCLTFISVVEAWVLFRAETFDGALAIYRASVQFPQLLTVDLLDSATNVVYQPVRAVMLIVICMVISFAFPNSQQFVEQADRVVLLSRRASLRRAFSIALAAFTSALLVLSISSMNKVSEFLYFQF